MKKKILLTLLVVMTLVCLLAISVNAAEQLLLLAERKNVHFMMPTEMHSFGILLMVVRQFKA